MDGNGNTSMNNSTIEDLNNSLQVNDRHQELLRLAREEFNLVENNDIVLKLVDGIDKLKEILDSHDKIKRISIVCNMQSYWITLIIDYISSKAYYTDTSKQKIDENLRNILLNHVSNMDIVNLQLGNAAQALVNAKIINKRLDNAVPVAEGVYKEITDSVEIVLQKFNILLKYMKSLNDAKSINGRNANIFIYFLETVALQDMKLRDKYGNKLNLNKVIKQSDIDRVSLVRNHLVHRKLNASSQTFTWIEPKDLNDIIELKNSNILKALQTYLSYIQQKLYDEYIQVPNDLKTPSLIFKKNFTIGVPISKIECENRITTFMRTAMSEAFDKKRLKSNNAREQIFEFIVNIVPFMKSQKNNMLNVLGTQRNDQIHAFYKYVNNESEIAFAFRHYMRQNKKHLYAFFLSKIVGELLSNPQNNYDTIKMVKTDIDTVKNFVTNGSGEIFKTENQSNDIIYNTDQVPDWFKLLIFLDNESAVHDRKKNQEKSIHVKGRHIELTADDREQLINSIQFLKKQYGTILQNNSKNPEEFNNNWLTLKNEYVKYFTFDYGIMGEHLKTLFMYIEKKILVVTDNLYNETVKNIIENVETLVNIKRSKKMNVKDIIYHFSNVNLKDGKVDISLSNTETNQLSHQRICITRFSVKIFEMLCKDDVFKNIEEAFNDEDFLDYLEIHSVHPQFVDQFPDFAAPYMGRLLNKSYTDFQKFYTVHLNVFNLKERREKILTILMGPNYKHHLYRFMSKDFHFYWNIAINIILKKNNLNAGDQLNVLKKMTITWMDKSKSQTKNIYIDFLNLRQNEYSQGDLASMLLEIRKLLDNNQSKKITNRRVSLL